MSVEVTLHRAAEEVRRGDLASVLRARQRLVGLVGSYPNRLDVRQQLAAVYRVLGEQAQAGRWSYLCADRDPAEVAAFERAYRRPADRLAALSWAGPLDEAETELARSRLAALHLEAQIQLQRELDATPDQDTSGGTCLLVMLGAIVVLLCFVMGAVTLVNFVWKLVS